jgi:serine/threonine protein kinase
VVRDELHPGDIIAGRYRIVRPIGAGGMGAVYEAEQLTLGRRVALKVLFENDERALARFEQEGRGASRHRTFRREEIKTDPPPAG